MTNYSELVKTVNIPELVKALRCNALSKQCDSCKYGYHLCPDSECNDACNVEQVYADAAAAIEELEADNDILRHHIDDLDEAVWSESLARQKAEAEVKRLKECNDELREAQTYIDHYGDKWLTSAKDVPTSAYNHGYMDGKNEAEQALEPKRGKWIHLYKNNFRCSLCGSWFVFEDENNPYEDGRFCSYCGAKMEVQE